jgi:hypothetical protein
MEQERKQQLGIVVRELTGGRTQSRKQSVALVHAIIHMETKLITGISHLEGTLIAVSLDVRPKKRLKIICWPHFPIRLLKSAE